MKRENKFNNNYPNDLGINNFENNDNDLMAKKNNIKLISMDAYSHRIINILQSKYFDLFIKLLYDEFLLKIKEKLQEFYNMKKTANWFIIFQKIFKSKKYVFNISIYKFEINEMTFKYLVYTAKTEVEFLISEAIKYKKTNKYFIDNYIEKMKKIREKIKSINIFDINKIYNANKNKKSIKDKVKNKKQAIMYLYDQIGVSDELINKNFQAKNAEIIEEINRVRRETAINLNNTYETKIKNRYNDIKSKYYDLYKPNSPKKAVTDNKNKTIVIDKKLSSRENYKKMKDSINLNKEEVQTHRKYISNVTQNKFNINNSENKKDDELEEINQRILALKINNNINKEENKTNESKKLYSKYIFSNIKNKHKKNLASSIIYKNKYPSNNRYKNNSYFNKNQDFLNSLNTVSYLSKEDFYYS
jgi:hypothetical protein